MSRAIARPFFVSDAPHFGGAERYIVAMCRAASRRGLQPGVLWVDRGGDGGPVLERLRQAGGPVKVLDGRPGRGAGLVCGFLGALDELAADALVFNACGRPGFWLLPWAARRRGLPCAWVHQMVDARDHRRLPARWWNGRLEGLAAWRVPQTLRHALAMAACRAVVTLNEADAERIVRWMRAPRDRLHVIPHGVDCAEYRFDAAGGQRVRASLGIPPAGSGRLVIGTAGRLVRGKGVDLLIRAAALLRDRGLDVDVLVAGQGEAEAELAELAGRLGLAGRVHFAGFMQDMPAFYSALDAFVLCSLTESFGLAIAEAMACCRPVIATPTCGASRQIEHGVNGLLLPAFEAGALAGAMAGLAGDPGRAASLGQAGRQSVLRRYSIERTLERTLRALRSPGRPRPCAVDPLPAVGVGEEHA